MGTLFSPLIGERECWSAGFIIVLRGTGGLVPQKCVILPAILFLLPWENVDAFTSSALDNEAVVFFAFHERVAFRAHAFEVVGALRNFWHDGKCTPKSWTLQMQKKNVSLGIHERHRHERHLRDSLQAISLPILPRREGRARVEPEEIQGQ